MNVLFKFLSVLSTSFIFLGITGCQSIQPSVQSHEPFASQPIDSTETTSIDSHTQENQTTETQTSEILEDTNTDTEFKAQFDLRGKIGVKTPKQSGSAFFTWHQNDDQYEIELSGILGVGKTKISGQEGHVSLNSAKTGLITADSAEELLFRATGWHAPITHLAHWVQAKPASPNAQIVQDESARIVNIEEEGWHIQLFYSDKALLPNRLILKQALEDGLENRITMVIQNR